MTNRGWAQIALAWLPIWLLYTVMVQGSTGWPPGRAAAVSLRAIFVAGLLAIVVWRWTAESEWPRPMNAWFGVKHFGAALLFGSVWVLGVEVVESLVAGVNPLDYLGWAPDLPLRVAVGAGLYGVVFATGFAERMTTRLHEERERATRAEAEAAQAELAVLRSRVRPHFLFNALNSIAELVHQDAEVANRAIESLARLLRVALEPNRDLVPLHEEWAFAKGYLDLELLRYDRALSVVEDFDPDSLHLPVPAFSLQGLVENAVRHGIAPKGTPGAVRVWSRRGEAAVEFGVSDDGVGPRAGWDAGRGVGLGGLRRRVEAMYGPGGSVHAGPGPEAGFDVTVRIPCAPPAAWAEAP